MNKCICKRDYVASYISGRKYNYEYFDGEYKIYFDNSKYYTTFLEEERFLLNHFDSYFIKMEEYIEDKINLILNGINI